MRADNALTQRDVAETNGKEKLIPEGFILFITLFANIVCIVPVIAMGVMHGIGVGFLEGTRKMVTLYESITNENRRGDL